jgi:molecular chaperone IbpA
MEDQMTTIDLRPFYRSVRDFDRLAQRLVSGVVVADSGPAVDIAETAADKYLIQIALPGWKQDELTLSVENGVLTVKGQPAKTEGQARLLQRGILRQAFELRFALAEHVEVKGARLDSGLLDVELAREVPEALKPRLIAINGKAGELPKAA